MTVGVWVGRADGTPSPGQFGANTAAPLLFQTFDHLPSATDDTLDRPENALPLVPENLPPGLRYLGQQHIPVAMNLQNPPPRIVFPLDGTVLQMPSEERGFVLEAEGGQRPFTWVIDGKPVGTPQWRRQTEWSPDGPGFSEIVLIDGDGARARAKVQLIEGE
jgi:penicillin-binding protein 1C